jgi:hypothetical protein
MFDADKFTQIWLLVRDDYPSLSDRAVKILLPSVTTYMCETGFSAVAVMKIKHQSNDIKKGATSCHFISEASIW